MIQEKHDPLCRRCHTEDKTVEYILYNCRVIRSIFEDTVLKLMELVHAGGLALYKQTLQNISSYLDSALRDLSED